MLQITNARDQQFMKIFFAFILMLFSFFNAYAQRDTLAGKNYFELTNIIREAKDTATSLGVTRYYLTKAQKEINLLNQWHGIRTLSLIHFQNKNFAKSDVYMNQLLALVKNNDALDTLIYETQAIGGRFSIRKGAINRSLQYFNDALNIAKEEQDISKMQRAYYFINLVQAMGGDYREAIATQHSFLKQINSADTTRLSSEKKKELILLANSSIADSYLKAKNADSGYYYSKKVLDRKFSAGDSCRVKYLYWQLALAEVYKKRYDEALLSVDSAKSYCTPLTRIDSLIEGGVMGKLFLGKKDYKKAISALENGINAYDVPDDEEGFMDDLYFDLATAYKEDGDIETAGYYLGKHIHTQEEFGIIKDSINSGFRQQEIDQFKEELDTLEEEKNTQKSYLNYLLLTGSIIILTLFFFLLKFYRNKKTDEVKFEALLTRINAAKEPSQIIDTKDEVLEEKTASDVSPEVTKQILDGLKKLEDKEYFLKQDCNSYNVAKRINTNTSYLSKVINSHYGKNFNTYINDLRISYAIVRLKNDVFFRSFSIQAIAEEVGYKSADSFTKYFKKDTGLNPSFYIKNIKNVA